MREAAINLHYHPLLDDVVLFMFGQENVLVGHVIIEPLKNPSSACVKASLMTTTRPCADAGAPPPLDFKRFRRHALGTLAQTNGVFLGTTFVAIGLGSGEGTVTLANWALFCGIVAFVCFLVSTILALTSLVVALLHHGDVGKPALATAVIAALTTGLGLVWLLASAVLIVQARVGPAFTTGAGLATTTVFLAAAAVLVMCACGLGLFVFLWKRWS